VAAAAAVLALAVPLTPHSTAVAAAGSKFLKADTTKHTAALKLIAGLTRANSGMNFDGYAKGSMTVTIPMGYKVTVTFTDKDITGHSALIVAFANRDGSSHTLAFSHAGSPDTTAGTQPGNTVKFTFVAKRTGKFAIICGVDSHAKLGMWDVLKVTSSGTPQITFKKATASSGPTSTPNPYPY
jgi:uncharacterized cupredoxin-like copper-binding protein